MTHSAQTLNGFLHRYPWLAVLLWIVGVVVVKAAGLLLVMGAYIGGEPSTPERGNGASQ
ncbi:hypothetical protein [Nocardiopsis dassonvillei]|uniref:hypothetical protein n=1 Tax=Nocardiopsis dassonvillei TaxID=2014 RepID=UPI003672059B